MKQTNNSYAMTMMIPMISFLGFVLENTWLSLTKGYIDNRGMYLPFLLGYGLAVVTIYLIFDTPSRFAQKYTITVWGHQLSGYLVYFGIMIFLISTGEIMLGTIMEKCCGIVYWNYLSIPLHITKYTSIPTSIGFSMILMLFEEYCFCPLLEWIQKMPERTLQILSRVAFIVLLCDCLHGFYIMNQTGKLNVLWRVQVDKTMFQRVFAQRG